MRRLLSLFMVAGLLGLMAFLWLTSPEKLEVAALPDHQVDIIRGESIFHAGGCASCHAAPASNKCEDLKSKDKKILAGGRCFKTPFGTFVAPNISPDKTNGIGAWSKIDFVNAMVKGVSPDGAHYYPAFPYTSYQRMTLSDILDLKAYMDTLPKSSEASQPHDLALPFRLRRGLGLWKLVFLDGKTFEPDPAKSDEWNRGAYLVEGPGHCGACHSPRNLAGGFIAGREYSGGPSPEGKGSIPNITPHSTGIEDWSEADIADALENGITPEFDTFGGTMVAVQENMAKLSAADRKAIAVYLKSLKPVKSDHKQK